MTLRSCLDLRPMVESGVRSMSEGTTDAAAGLEKTEKLASPKAAAFYGVGTSTGNATYNTALQVMHAFFIYCHRFPAMMLRIC